MSVIVAFALDQIRQAEERCAQYELTIDRLAREKTSLASDLDDWKNRIQRQEIDLSQASDSVKLQIQKAMRERDQANSSAMQIRTDFEKLLLQSNQVGRFDTGTREMTHRVCLYEGYASTSPSAWLDPESFQRHRRRTAQLEEAMPRTRRRSQSSHTRGTPVVTTLTYLPSLSFRT